jgi:hypothetical protein
MSEQEGQREREAERKREREREYMKEYKKICLAKARCLNNYCQYKRLKIVSIKMPV